MKNVNYLIENGVNVNKSLELFGDIETFNETLVDFVKDIDEKIANLNSSKEKGDMKNYAIYAHSIKTDARYFGFEKLADLSLKHELEGKANNLYFVYENYDALYDEIIRIVNISKVYLGETVETIKEEKTINESILVVDDSNIIRNIIDKMIDNNYKMISACDGEEALKIIESNDSAKIVGMFLDLNMPNVDGFSVLDYFNAKDLFKKIPIIIITGEEGKSDRLANYSIIDVVKKPFNEEVIRQALNKIKEIDNENKCNSSSL